MISSCETGIIPDETIMPCVETSASRANPIIPRNRPVKNRAIPKMAIPPADAESNPEKRLLGLRELVGDCLRKIFLHGLKLIELIPVDHIDDSHKLS